MSTALQNFSQHFQVSWMTLLVGWRGFGHLRRLVTISDIAQFSLARLEATPESNSKLADLATISESDSSRVDSRLAGLASPSANDYETEVRKWVVCLLKKKLEQLPNDPVYGLLQLTEFWADLDFPEYSPHQVQGKGNTLSAAEYYTQQNYAKALTSHKKWIEQELLRLSREHEAGGRPLTHSGDH